MPGFLYTVLISAIGAAVAFWFQARGWRQRRRSERAENERKLAMETIHLLSETFDRRFFSQRQLIEALNREAEYRVLVDAYQDQVTSWFATRSTIVAQLKVMFDEQAAKDFVNLIAEPMHRSDEGIQLTLRHGDNLSTQDKRKVQNRTYWLLSSRRGFERVQATLLTRVTLDEVGTIQFEKDIHRAKLTELSTTSLIWRLFSGSR